MKYLTKKWATGGLTDDQYESAYKACQAHYKSLQKEANVAIQQLLEINIHDAELREARWRKKNLELFLRIGESQAGYFDAWLIFENAKLDKSVEKLLFSKKKETELLYDEIHKKSHGRFSYELLIFPYREIAIEFKKAKVIKAFQPKYDLEKHFQGLVFRSPLFYSWPIGVRFELNKNTKHRSLAKRLNACVARAEKIAKAVFKDEKNIFVVIQSPSDHINDCTDLIKGSLISPAGLEGYLPKTIENPYHESPTRKAPKNWEQRWWGLQSNLLNYKKLFTLIANKDFSSSSYCMPEVFIIGPKQNLIFYMYDDRGIDLIASNKKALKRFHVEY